MKDKIKNLMVPSEDLNKAIFLAKEKYKNPDTPFSQEAAKELEKSIVECVAFNKAANVFIEILNKNSETVFEDTRKIHEWLFVMETVKNTFYKGLKAIEVLSQ